MAKRNFLLGKGERLVEDIVVKGGGGPKTAPYTFEEARTRLTPMLKRTIQEINSLPQEACPDDRVVASITLNPEYIAKSYFPSDLFLAIGVEAVGSRPKKIVPEKRSGDRVPEETISTELFVAGKRSAFRNWSEQLPNWATSSIGAAKLPAIESIEAKAPRTKIKGALPRQGEVVFEIVLHADGLEGELATLSYFKRYLTSLGINSDLKRRFYAGGLCFVELNAAASLASKIATFTLVRAIRRMPSLRMLKPLIPRAAIPGQQLVLPTSDAMDRSIRAAIFDGGIPEKHPLIRWAKPIDTAGLGKATPDCLEHGISVTSAFLFGHLEPSAKVSVPFCNVDHYRVIDGDPKSNPYELFDVLQRIENVLSTKDYDFINLSLGPSLPVDDDEVHAWTAVLDSWLARKNSLLAVAVGNNGEGDAEAGLNRVQVPSDAVNAIAIGAADTPDSKWIRAPYSAVGPGRSPGLIKPDLVDFGGSIQRPFLVTAPSADCTLLQTGGTSFAAPSVLRLGAGVRAHFGGGLNLLAIRTLLVHSAEDNGLPREEIGWGRVARSLDNIVLCDDDCVRVVFQGEISPSKYIRAPIPVPVDEIPGKVEIIATLAYTTPVDPHHPGNYTRAALEATFRPHSEKRKDPEKQLHANTHPFFGVKAAGVTEDLLRRDAMKWENCQHASVSMYGRSLKGPVFDIHYNARLEGHNHAPADALKYALVITVRAKRIADLYDQIVRRYRTQLEQIQPVIDIPVRI